MRDPAEEQDRRLPRRFGVNPSARKIPLSGRDFLLSVALASRRRACPSPWVRTASGRGGVTGFLSGLRGRRGALCRPPGAGGCLSQG